MKTATEALQDIEHGLQSFINKNKGKSAEVDERLFAIEQKLSAPGGSPMGSAGSSDNIGRAIVESEQFKSFQSAGARNSGRINVGSFHKTAIVNATGASQPLVQDYRVGLIAPTQRRLRIADLLPRFPTNSNLVGFTRELSFTNAAAPQTGGSPNSGENVAKAESAISFELATAPVQTIATWIPASRQVLDDSAGLQSYLNQRLTYFVKASEEDELLNGSGSGNHLSGLITQATAFDVARTTAVSDTYMDVLSHAIAQLAASELEADGIILNPADWEVIRLTKETGTGISSGSYLLGDPRVAGPASLFSVPVVRTNAMARGQFLVGAFGLAAAVWDRQDATVEVSREHSDFFVRNMAAILAEERIALTVFRPSALIYGGFPFGS